MNYNPNQAPNITGLNSSYNYTWIEGQNLEISFNVSDSDGNLSSVSADIGTIVDRGNGSYTLILIPDDLTTSKTITITARDTDGAESSQTINVNVEYAASWKTLPDSS